MAVEMIIMKVICACYDDDGAQKDRLEKSW